MSKAIPTVQKFMTTSPHTIGEDQTLAQASELMHEFRIRHLPVLAGGKLVGMLTERDLAVIGAMRGVDPKRERASDAMSTEVYAVSPDAPLDEVVLEMAANRYGSAVIVQNNHVVGVFTNIDAYRALGELLHTRLS
jgi:acetoin utilization protein AcuB